MEMWNNLDKKKKIIVVAVGVILFMGLLGAFGVLPAPA